MDSSSGVHYGAGVGVGGVFGLGSLVFTDTGNITYEHNMVHTGTRGEFSVTIVFPINVITVNHDQPLQVYLDCIPDMESFTLIFVPDQLQSYS